MNIPLVMRAVSFDGGTTAVGNHPVPRPPHGWALIRVHEAGICKTDMEITKGYLGFRGILGHEFTGMVVRCDSNPRWVGKLVTGEINASCGSCESCLKGLGRHCPNRLTLGIQGLDGCMAEYCTLPVANLLEIPEGLPRKRAIMIEPLSAAFEILEQLQLNGQERVIVLGDGRLGILCAWVLCTVVADVTLIGHHQGKLEIAKWRHIHRTDRTANVSRGADIVVDATGSSAGLRDALAFCRPRGTVVLKSTIADPYQVDLSPLVIHEINLVGSRCGRFHDGLAIMRAWPDMPLERLISARYSIDQALAALEKAAEPESFKVVLDIVQA